MQVCKHRRHILDERRPHWLAVPTSVSQVVREGCTGRIWGTSCRRLFERKTINEFLFCVRLCGCTNYGIWDQYAAAQTALLGCLPGQRLGATHTWAPRIFTSASAAWSIGSCFLHSLGCGQTGKQCCGSQTDWFVRQTSCDSSNVCPSTLLQPVASDCFLRSPTRSSRRSFPRCTF